MPKKKLDPVANLAAEVETLTENEALRALEATKGLICDRAKQVAQQKEAKADIVAGYNDTLKILGEELDTELTRKALIEDHLKRLNVQAGA